MLKGSDGRSQWHESDMDEGLNQQLEELEEGEELTVDEDGEEVTYIRPKKPVYCTEHEFEDAGNGDKQCIKCGQGRVSDKTDDYTL